MSNLPRKISFLHKTSIYTRRILGSVSVYLFMLGLFSIIRGFKNSDLEYIFRNDGEWIETKAAFFKTQESSSQTANQKTDIAFICNFQFESKNGLIKKAIPIKNYEASKLKITGDSIYIQYKTDNPERAHPYGFAKKWTELFLCALFFILSLVTLLINLFVKRKFVWLLKHGVCVISQNVVIKPLFLDTQKIKRSYKYELKADFIVNGQTYYTNPIFLKLPHTGREIVLNELQSIQILYNPKQPSENFPIIPSDAFPKFKISETDELELNLWFDYFQSSSAKNLIVLGLIIYILLQFVIATFF